MNENLLQFLQKSVRALFTVNSNKNRVTYANETATSLYGITTDTTDIDVIFSENKQDTQGLLSQHLSSSDCFFLPNYVTTTKTGGLQLADLHMGFLNRQEGLFFVELTPKEDTQLADMVNYADSSCSPMFLLKNDSNFSIYHGNQAFYQCFPQSEKEFQEKYAGSMQSFFQTSGQQSILEKVQAQLESPGEANLNFSITTEKGDPKWFYLNLMRKKLWLGGEILQGFLVEADHQVQVSSKLTSIAQQFDVIQKLSPDTLFFIDPKSRIVVHRGERAVQLGLPEVMVDFPESMYPRIHPEDLEDFKLNGQRMIEGMCDPFTQRVKMANGDYQWFRFETATIFNKEGEPSEIIGKMKNVTTEKEPPRCATLDLLTDTLNKLSMEESVGRLLERAHADEKHALFSLDIDDYTYVNDRFGENFGNYLLKELGKRLGKAMRHGDLVGRVGGDEFVIFMRNIPNRKVLVKKAEKILSSIGEEFSNGEKSHHIAVSIGIAEYPKDGNCYEELFQKAELALEVSKKGEKSVPHVYDPEVDGLPTT